MDDFYVLHVTEQDFKREVIDRSHEVPVLVDLWAPWCGPCQALGPMLERLANEHRGAFILAKVNTDECPQIAEAFQARSIPAVHLIVGGQVVDSFVGALPEAQIREFLKPHLKSPEDGAGDDAEGKGGGGDVAGAKADLEKRLEKDPKDLQAHLLLARIAFGDGDREMVLRHIEALPEGSEEARTAAPLADALQFQAECDGDESAWRTKVEADPEDLDARYALACCLAASGGYADALREFLEVVKRNKGYREGAAHKAMLTIFALPQADDDLAREFRRQLTIYL